MSLTDVLIGVAAVVALLLVAPRRQPAGAGRPGRGLVTVDNLADAVDLLDALEAGGCADRQLVVLEDSRFAVCWR